MLIFVPHHNQTISKMSSKLKYQNKYRIASARKPGWDYRNKGAYFITICTAKRKHYFGEIKNEVMALSNIGVLADVFWHEIKNHSENVTLDAFIVMPNHIHGILILDGDHHGMALSVDNSLNEHDHGLTLDEHDHGLTLDEHGLTLVETLHATSLPGKPGKPDIPDIPGKPDIPGEPDSSESKSIIPLNPTDNSKSAISPKSNSISTIMRSYKSAVTKHAHRLGYDFEWQARFHDHIIRDERAYGKIANYIRANVSNWKEDKFFEPEQ